MFLKIKPVITIEMALTDKNLFSIVRVQIASSYKLKKKKEMHHENRSESADSIRRSS